MVFGCKQWYVSKTTPDFSIEMRELTADPAGPHGAESIMTAKTENENENPRLVPAPSQSRQGPFHAVVKMMADLLESFERELHEGLKRLVYKHVISPDKLTWVSSLTHIFRNSNYSPLQRTTPLKQSSHPQAEASAAEARAAEARAAHHR